MSYVPLSPALIAGGITKSVPKIWVLLDTAADATVSAAGYISDAQSLGMTVGDIVLYFKTDTAALYIHAVTAVSSTGATLTLSTVPVSN